MSAYLATAFKHAAVHMSKSWFCLLHGSACPRCAGRQTVACLQPGPEVGSYQAGLPAQGQDSRHCTHVMLVSGPQRIVCARLLNAHEEPQSRSMCSVCCTEQTAVGSLSLLLTGDSLCRDCRSTEPHQQARSKLRHHRSIGDTGHKVT